ncbi:MULTISPECIES: bifunctional aspartate kinase/homoserine dehydrogenase II [Corallincola]|uniref:Bifunctional aspartokinase/homoserine dehydrogenase n=3 Tax=Corallincola TaxID=1775176 RepID=A0A368N6G4_9GAMM|nr:MULTISPECIES: bifunctional aspartate kinase/homoserine dehydrogenase II [Corallincola]RCU45105.1 bifunctional aspartate kinase/homoserine dehydrogenase II [Corallincola holothuriorum]TAA46849.1 aspartate kinase [Corallincola spongiicola]TCI04495.1 aspartate kinase [Corallincola luteus]
MWQHAQRSESVSSRSRVHKFGGSSLADADCYLRVVELLKEHTSAGDLVVVSAAGKTTNALVLCSKSAGSNDELVKQTLTDLERFQGSLITQLLDGAAAKQALQSLSDDLNQIQTLLQAGDESARYNETVGFGELWSARLLAALLNQSTVPAGWLDAREIFSAQPGPQPEIDVALSQPKLAEQLLQRQEELTIVTGFISRGPDGETVTLGRNGSDYSATMLATLADAQAATIWTDVAGIFSADPNKVKGARTQPILSLAEAAELARLGSPVLHTRTLQPMVGRKTRLSIRSTFAATGSHTQIAPTQVGEKGAKIVTSLDKVCLISMNTSSRQAFEEATATIRAYLDRYQLVPLAKQYQPDQRLIRLCFTAEVAETAFARLKDFQLQGAFCNLTLNDNYALAAMVGDGVTENARHYHCFYRHLQDAPVEFIQPGEHGLSLVAVLRETDLDTLLSHMHHGISSPDKKLGVALFGTGNIGSGWLRLYQEQQHYLSNYHRLEVQLCALYNQDGAIIDFTGIEVDDWQARFQQHKEDMGFEQLLELLAGHPYDELVVIDATDSRDLAYQYPALMEHGIHLISANKYPASAPLSLYREITQQRKEKAVVWLNNATVGAGLPVHYVTGDLQHSGDEVVSISGVWSGTMSWLLQQYDGKQPFSSLIREAMDQGLTEPDPREDLTGEDVCCKLLILARQLGMEEFEMDDIEVVSLVDEEALEGSIEEFFANAEVFDRQIASAYGRAEASGRVLRYIARLERGGQAHVGLEFLDPSDPMANCHAGENIYAIHSEWFKEQPLVIRGPAVGPELTAGSVQSDLFKLCQHIKSA